MFYWHKFFVETHHLDARLTEISSAARVAFAAGCAWHAIVPFERLRTERRYAPSSPVLLSSLLSVIDEALRSNLENHTGEIAANLNKRLADLIGPNYWEFVAYNEGELLNATDKVVDCLTDSRSLKSALLGAKSSYVAVSKWYDAKAFPGRVRKAEQVLEFEINSPDCKAERDFQLNWFAELRRGSQLPRSCDEIGRLMI